MARGQNWAEGGEAQALPGVWLEMASIAESSTSASGWAAWNGTTEVFSHKIVSETRGVPLWNSQLCWWHADDSHFAITVSMGPEQPRIDLWAMTQNVPGFILSSAMNLPGDRRQTTPTQPQLPYGVITGNCNDILRIALRHVKCFAHSKNTIYMLSIIMPQAPSLSLLNTAFSVSNWQNLSSWGTGSGKITRGMNFVSRKEWLLF